MGILPSEPEPLDGSAEQRASNDIIRLIRKLRWMRMEDEAKCVETELMQLRRHEFAAFLSFSKSHGNDLSTPMPKFGFQGLKPGDRWCLCTWLARRLEASQAPRVVLQATRRRCSGSLLTCRPQTLCSGSGLTMPGVSGSLPPWDRTARRRKRQASCAGPSAAAVAIRAAILLDTN